MTIRIACCGWQSEDWVGPFYPPELRNRRAGWLEYYGRYFDSVEIDSTYYSMPGAQTLEAWIQKGKRLTHDKNHFEFSLKMHKDITHGLMVDGKSEEAAQRANDFENFVCHPLKERGLLGAVLIQLSPFFQATGKNGRSNIHVLEKVLGALDTKGIDYVVEFRHRTWLDGRKTEILPDALDLLRYKNVAVCVLDSPGFPTTAAQTADHAYIRFHGRNHDLWFAKEKPDGDTRINRYDYLYTDDELEPWVERVRNTEKPPKEGGEDGEDWEDRWRDVRIAFNNHGHAKAVKNGLRFRAMLGLETEKRSSLEKRKTLEDFG